MGSRVGTRSPNGPRWRSAEMGPPTAQTTGEEPIVYVRAVTHPTPGGDPRGALTFHASVSDGDAAVMTYPDVAKGYRA